VTEQDMFSEIHIFSDTHKCLGVYKMHGGNWLSSCLQSSVLTSSVSHCSYQYLLSVSLEWNSFDTWRALLNQLCTLQMDSSWEKR